MPEIHPYPVVRTVVKSYSGALPARKVRLALGIGKALSENIHASQGRILAHLYGGRGVDYEGGTGIAEVALFFRREQMAHDGAVVRDRYVAPNIVSAGPRQPCLPTLPA